MKFYTSKYFPSEADRTVDREIELLLKLLPKPPYSKLLITFQNHLFTSLYLNETDCNSACIS